MQELTIGQVYQNTINKRDFAQQEKVGVNSLMFLLTSGLHILYKESPRELSVNLIIYCVNKHYTV